MKSAFKQASLVQDALRVRALHGKSLLEQATEIVRIKRRNPTLGATDYYAYRLYDPAFLGSSSAEDFLGWRAQEELALSLNFRTLVLPAWDKASFTVMANAYGLPIPALRAFYRPGCPPSDNFAEVCLDQPAKLSNWLRTQPRWPLFAKPSYGQKGLGCHHLVGYDSATDTLLCKNADPLPVEQFVASVVERPSGPYFQREMGYLFQEVLNPDPRIADLVGNSAISGVRIVVAQDESGPEIVTAVWKIAAKDNHTDNWRRGTDGTLVAAIDLRSGALRGVVEGIWPRARFVTNSPVTGQRFENFVVPHFEQMLGLCKSAATIFPLLRIQYWDIAPTDRGPVILEVNDMGGIGSLQLHGQGLLRGKIRSLLGEHGDPRKFGWVRETRR